MENYLFPQEFLTDGWLSPSPTLWAVNAIFAFVCGLGLFVFLLSYFHPDPSSPQGKKHKKSGKYQVEPRRRSNRSKKYQTAKGECPPLTPACPSYTVSPALKAQSHCLQDTRA
ncbi:spermatogenesis-associated protein 31E1-like [Mustela lutreola]|uniref:spermatogenesis-associated protein 31E1-like n=1 Tax=Mustela lutreola TaxID=9666 RepID=UPI002796EBB7|nr:spermatogenesis-associated protein 31E1-like [Mustela lutreola]